MRMRRRRRRHCGNCSPLECEVGIRAGAYAMAFHVWNFLKVRKTSGSQKPGNSSEEEGSL